MTRSVRYQPILHTIYYMLHTEHAYCLSYHFLNNVVTTTIIEMVEMVEILDGRLGKHSAERVRLCRGGSRGASAGLIRGPLFYSLYLTLYTSTHCYSQLLKQNNDFQLTHIVSN